MMAKQNSLGKHAADPRLKKASSVSSEYVYVPKYCVRTGKERHPAHLLRKKFRPWDALFFAASLMLVALSFFVDSWLMIPFLRACFAGAMVRLCRRPSLLRALTCVFCVCAVSVFFALKLLPYFV